MLGRLLSVLPFALCVTCGGAEPQRPSVVLVLVDQLRYDAAERWLVETRALAERGVRFEAMRAAAPWTYPSVTSLLSGLYPQQHGADANQEGTRLTTISASVPMLPRTLRAAGYHTAAFVTNPFFHEWNRPFAEGFEHFEAASFIGNQGPTRGHGDKVWTARMYSDTVNAEVRRYFDAHPLAGPEFVYVHYIDVHGRKESADRWRDAPFEPGYESAVRYVDGKVRELYEYFSARYGGELLFVVTSDHGQDLDDDLAVGDDRPLRKRKASLHDFNLRIPCYILPSPLVSPRVIAEPTSNVDVAPTLLAWLGLAPLGPGPGVSLLDALRGQPYDGEGRSLYARNTTGQRFEEGVVHAHTKLVRYRDPLDGTVKIRRMVDLEKDPRELEGLPQDTSAAEALLDREAEAGGLVYPARFEELDDAMRAQLDDMGYGGDEDESKRR